MPDFKPINTQEELDALLAPRLERERKMAAEPFADYQKIKDDLAAANKTLGEKDAAIADLNTQLKSARTDLAKTRTALAKGLPLSVVESLRGETEEELGKSADALAVLAGSKKSEPEPARELDPVSNGSKADAYSAGLGRLLDGLGITGE